MSLGASWKGLGGSLDVGEDKNSKTEKDEEKRTGWWKVSKVTQCAQFEHNCMTNKSYFSPFAQDVLDDLQKHAMKNDDADTMKEWYDRFIKPWGTHVVVGASHGAAVQASHSLDNTCKQSNECRNVDMALKFDFF